MKHILGCLDLHSNYEMLQLLDASSKKKKLELERLKIQSYFVNKNKNASPDHLHMIFNQVRVKKNLCQLKRKNH